MVYSWAIASISAWLWYNSKILPVWDALFAQYQRNDRPPWVLPSHQEQYANHKRLSAAVEKVLENLYVITDLECRPDAIRLFFARITSASTFINAPNSAYIMIHKNVIANAITFTYLCNSITITIHSVSTQLWSHCIIIRFHLWVGVGHAIWAKCPSCLSEQCNIGTVRNMKCVRGTCYT